MSLTLVDIQASDVQQNREEQTAQVELKGERAVASQTDWRGRRGTQNVLTTDGTKKAGLELQAIAYLNTLIGPSTMQANLLH